MGEYTKTSLARLQQVHPDLRAVMLAAQASWAGAGRFQIAEALRTIKRQKELVAKGKSKTMKSRHLHGFAVDVAYFLDIDKDGDDDYVTDGNKYIALAQHILDTGKLLGIVMRWGGDWDMDGIPVGPDPDESFFDAAHFELHAKYYPDP